MHSTRSARILRAHPEVRALLGPEWRSKWVCLALVAAQLALATTVPQRSSWVAYLALTYFVGATLTQALFLAVHELTHDLFFASPRANRAFALVANAPLVVPFATDFRTYHLAHHAHLGVEGKDLDLPSALEARLLRGFTGRSAILPKLVWCALQIVAYALRPVLTSPPSFTQAHAVAWSVQLSVDAALVYACGSGAPLRYLCLCLLLAGGLHPTAGHFLSEHYVFEEKEEKEEEKPFAAAAPAAPPQETFSYYGMWNCVTWNVGYHVEHHDLPRVPWSRLPAVRAMAPEFYDGLRTCPSWSRIVWKYATRGDMGPHRRVTRRAD